MILKDNIKTLVGNHVPPHMYNSGVFQKGITPIFYSGQYWDNQETEAAIDAFLNGKWIAAGEHVHDFEQKFSYMFRSDYSLMVNSGSSANLILIASLKKYYNWKDGDEIIVSPAGFPTTISVIYQNRLTPVFADIEWETLNFDLTKVEEKINLKTVAIFLSPVLGNPPDMDKLYNLCFRCNIKLIVDNCDSLGSKWGDNYLTEYGVGSSCSFYPAHHISTGEGGMVSTNNRDLYNIMRSMATWGRDCRCIGSANITAKGACGHRFDRWLDVYDGIVDHKYIFSNIGYNLKPLDLQGAIGCVQLNKFSEIRQKRNHSKRVIEEIILNHINGVSGVSVFSKADVCWFGTPFICDNAELKHRLVKYLESQKIQTRNYFSGNILMHPGYKHLGNYKDYPESSKVLENVFFLGSAPHYTSEVFDYIEEVIKKF